MGGRLAVVAAAVLVFALPGAADAAAKKAWYVRAGAKDSGTGTRRAPFSSLAAVQKAAKARQTIVILPAGAPLDGGIQLKPGQRLVGAGPAVAGRTRKLKLLPAVQNTSATNIAGDAIRLAKDATVRNVVVKAASRGGIYGLDTTGVTVAGNDVSGVNTSCQNGFLVQPFNVPTGVPGVLVPASPAVAPQNGWAAIMVDGQKAAGAIAIHRNRIHDSTCADGIDIRAMGTSKLTARLTRNTVTHMKEGDAGSETGAIGSILAIGMQALDQGRLRITQDRNTQTYIGDEGADCEGQFINTAGAGQVHETVDHNTFAHGIGGSSCNGFETIVSNGTGTIDLVLRNSTFRDNQGDMFEEGNLGAGSVMRFVADNVLVDGTHERGGNPPGSSDGGSNPVPFNLGDCMVAGHNGGGNSTTFVLRHSIFRNCNNGLSLLSNVGQGNGSGPAKELVAEISDSVITKNAKYGVHFAMYMDMDKLSVNVANTEISNNGAAGASFELPSTAASSIADAKIAVAGSCLFGSSAGDVEANNLAVAADGNWWGQPGGPKDGQVVTGGSGKVTSSGGLAAKPSCGS